MTREELIEHHIYIPSKIDDSIKARLLIGDSVLFIRHNTPWLVRLTTANNLLHKTRVLYVCSEEDICWICEEFEIITYENCVNLYSSSPNSWSHVLYVSRENIDKFIKKLHD